MRQPPPVFGILPATAGRVIQRLGPLLALKPVRALQGAVERLWTVDGTRTPVRDRGEGGFWRNYRFGPVLRRHHRASACR
jgi:hypothetical protein